MKLKAKIQKEIELDLSDFEEHILETYNEENGLEGEDQITDLQEVPRSEIKGILDELLCDDFSAFDLDLDETNVQLSIED